MSQNKQKNKRKNWKNDSEQCFRFSPFNLSFVTSQIMTMSYEIDSEKIFYLMLDF
jgi:hypothetical protein